MVDNRERIEDNSKAEEGFAAVTHDKTHVGMVTDVTKDEDGNVTEFQVTHNERPWERKDKAGNVVQKGGGKTHTETIRVAFIGKTREEGATNLEAKFYGLYKWDDLDEKKK